MTLLEYLTFSGVEEAVGGEENGEPAKRWVSAACRPRRKSGFGPVTSMRCLDAYTIPQFPNSLFPRFISLIRGKFPVPLTREFRQITEAFQGVANEDSAPEGPFWRKFPVFSLLIREFHQRRVRA